MIPFGLKSVFAVINILFGVVALVAPKRLGQAVGLDTDNPTGLAELRIGWGGLYIALGVAAVYMQSTSAFWLLGAGYAGMGATRLAHLIILNRKFYSPMQVGLMAFEFVSAFVFMIPSSL